MSTVYTHSGMFHFDDAMAVAIASLVNPDVEVRRVRDTNSLMVAEGDLVVDIGDKYDPIGGWFDHHQAGSPVRESDGHRFAAAGQVWLHFCDQCLEAMGYADPDGDIAQRVATVLVDGIDDADNGVPAWHAVDGKRPVSASALISMLNPPSGADEGLVAAKFRFAVTVAYESLKAAIHRAAAWIDARDSVHNCLAGGAAKWIRLERAGEWQEHVLNHHNGGEVLYVIFPSGRGGWMVQGVPITLGSLQTRKPFPSSWGCLKGEALKECAGLSTAGASTFCHRNLHLCGAETFEDATTLAYEAISA